MKSHLKYFALAIIIFISISANAQLVDSPEIQIEQLTQDRVLKIMDKVDPYSIVQTRVILKKVETNLPGVWFDAKVTPKGSKGEVGKDGIAEIQVRIITQVTFVPEWVKSEVLEALKLGSAKTSVIYEIGKGGLARAEDPLLKLPQIMDKFSRDLANGISTNLSTNLPTAMSTSLSKSLSTEFSTSLSDSMTKSLNATLPNAFGTAFSKGFSDSLADSLTKSLNATLPGAMSAAMAKVQQSPVAAAVDPQAKTGGAEQSAKGLENIKRGLWALVGGVFIAILILSFAVFSIGGRIEEALIRVVDGKLAPLFQQAGGGRAAKSKVDIGKASFEGKSGSQSGTGAIPVAAAGSRELAELSLEVILNLFADCYWTEQDGYASYLWSQMTQQQREEMLKLPEFQQAFGSYLPFIRQFEAVNLGHHSDSRYLVAASELRSLNQTDLASWLLANTQFLSRLTPLRWENLPISLADRMKLTMMASRSAAAVAEEKIPVTQRSAPRDLPMRLVVKKLTIADEIYVMHNAHDIPAHMRSALHTLAWLALCPIAYRKKALDEFNARELADAWVGPDEVLAGLIEALPNKKVGMLNSYLNESQPSRDTEMFDILVAAGLRGFDEMMLSKTSSGKEVSREAA